MVQDATLTYPPIDAPAALSTGELPSLSAVALAPLNAIETAVGAMAEKYRAVAYDCSTTKGMTDAKAARLELRERGRFAIQRAIEAFKKEANGAKKAIEGKGEELIAVLKPIEDAIDAQIKAEEDRKAAEKAAAEQRDRERKAAHQAGIDKITNYLEMARGMPSDRIRKGIDYLSGLAFGPEWEEYRSAAYEARDQTLAKMRQLCEEVAQREATEAENERLRAQIEELQKQTAAQAAPAIEQAIVNAAVSGVGVVTIAANPDDSMVEIARSARADIEEITTIRSLPLGSPTTAQQQDTRPPLDSFESAPWVMPTITPTAPAPTTEVHLNRKDGTPSGVVLVTVPAADEKATIKLGEICDWLGFAVRADFLAETLGIPHRDTDKAAKLYFPSDRPAIGRALIAHIGEKLGELGD